MPSPRQDQPPFKYYTFLSGLFLSAQTKAIQAPNTVHLSSPPPHFALHPPVALGFENNNSLTKKINPGPEMYLHL